MHITDLCIKNIEIYNNYNNVNINMNFGEFTFIHNILYAYYTLYKL